MCDLHPKNLTWDGKKLVLFDPMLGDRVAHPGDALLEHGNMFYYDWYRAAMRLDDIYKLLSN